MFEYKNKINNKKRGFTLIELLVVISIIGMLSSVVLSSLNDARAKARDVRRLQDLKQLQTAIMMFYSEYGCYPNGARPGVGTMSTLTNPCPTSGSVFDQTFGNCTSANDHIDMSLKILVEKGYIPSLPKDPLNKNVGTQAYCYSYNRHGGNSSIKCDGTPRSDFTYNILFSTEKSNFNFPKTHSQTKYNYCFTGDLI
jgi:prepilin-type N-terminal cleavage/methylation domain-containing protein